MFGLGGRGLQVPAAGVGMAALVAFGLTAAYAQGPIASVWDGAYTAEQATSGKAAYGEQCASCHGPSLGGGDSAPPLSGPAFQNNWNGTGVSDLFTRIHDTMPAQDPGSLSGKTTAEIEAYILQVNGFPAGQVALPSNPQMMGATKILATKPQ
jgi:S-disulfanyl-L-cysteine oxidoreductase SoxD